MSAGLSRLEEQRKPEFDQSQLSQVKLTWIDSVFSMFGHSCIWWIDSFLGEFDLGYIWDCL